MPDKIKKLFNSRRFWVSIATLVFAIMRERLGINISEEQMAEILALIAGWVVGDGIRPDVDGSLALNSKWAALLKSRRFVASVAGIVVVLANEMAGLGLDEAQVTQIVAAVVAWIVADSFRSSDE